MVRMDLRGKKSALCAALHGLDLEHVAVNRKLEPEADGEVGMRAGMNDQDLVKALRCISTAGGKEKENITLGGAVKLATMYHGGLGLETLVEWPSANVTHWPPLPKGRR